MKGRIWFEGNPWPDGHAVKALEFSLLLGAQGLGLLLDLESDDYYAKDPSYLDEGKQEDEAESDWEAKAVWGNYHRCRLSNTHWGINAASVPRIEQSGPMFDLGSSAPLRLAADPVAIGAESPKDYDDHAFHIYLTGHDAVAAHDIMIQRQENGLFSLRWSGLIALAYVGQNDFSHRFHAEAKDLMFAGYRIIRGDPSAASAEANARALAERYIASADALRFEAGVDGEPDWLRSPDYAAPSVAG